MTRTRDSIMLLVLCATTALSAAGQARMVHPGFDRQIAIQSGQQGTSWQPGGQGQMGLSSCSQGRTGPTSMPGLLPPWQSAGGTPWQTGGTTGPDVAQAAYLAWLSQMQSRSSYSQEVDTSAVSQPETAVPPPVTMMWLAWLGPTSSNAGISEDDLTNAGRALQRYLDANGDGHVTGNEFTDRQAEWFRALDTSGDGLITSDELAAAGIRGMPGSGLTGGTRDGTPGDADNTDQQLARARAQDAFAKARQDLRDAMSGGDRTAIAQARRAYWSARRANESAKTR
ncbi:MAG: hypothetical protein HY816_05310 [Candidatus Wallbacteria bacterium]|nr:hypothetical protein [Candidatus Wallbacteria bacterium]